MDGKSLFKWSQARVKYGIPPSTHSWQEVSLHSHIENGWIVLEGKIFDISEFLRFHPGGADELVPYLGKDATKAFSTILSGFTIIS